MAGRWMSFVCGVRSRSSCARMGALALVVCSISIGEARAQSRFSMIKGDDDLARHGDLYGTDVDNARDFVAVGAPRGMHELFDPGYIPAGCVYVHRLNSVLDYPSEMGTGPEVQRLFGAGPNFYTLPDDRFGTSVSFDELTLAVGAPGFMFIQELCADRTGAVIVFEQDPTTLTFPFNAASGGFTTAVMVGPSNGVDDEEFGFSVVLDGDRLFVGAPGAAHPSGGTPGAVYVFQRNGGTWTEVQKIFSSTAQGDGRFGHSLDVQGSELVVGAPLEDKVVGIFSINAVGYAYHFEDVPGVGWTQRNRIASSVEGANSRFGDAVAISRNSMAISAVSAQDGQGTFPGKVETLERDDNGTPSISDDTWDSTQTLTPPQNALPRRFGEDLDLEGDLLVVGAPWLSSDFQFPYLDPLPQGRVFVYERDGSAWVQKDVLTAPPSPPCVCGPLDCCDCLATSTDIGDKFGTAVSITRGIGEADHGVLIGAPRAYTGLPPSIAVEIPPKLQICPGDPGCPPHLCPVPPTTCPPDPESGTVCCPCTKIAVFCTSQAPLEGAFSTIPGAAFRYRLTLNGSTRTIDLSDGGTQELEIDGGKAAALGVYVVVGSITGVEPGAAAGNVIIPLVVDVYYLQILPLVGSLDPPFHLFVGALDANGKATASFVVPPGSSPDYAGTYYHAAAIFDSAGQVIVNATNPVELVLTP